MTQRWIGFWGAVCALCLLAGCPSNDSKGAGGKVGAEDTTNEPQTGIGDGEIGDGAGGGSDSGTSDLGASGAAGTGAAPAEAPGAAEGGGSADFAAGGADTSGGSDIPSDGEIDGSGTSTGQSGTLTAGAWDDNLNFDRFSDFRSELLQSSSSEVWPTTDAEHADAHDLFSGERLAKDTLDISLVIDTTGSMSDELSFLQTELLDISKTIEAKHPDAEQRWSLVLYKDDGDEYVVRWFDFRADAVEFREKLAAQSAGGGGDFPEAPDQAFEQMNKLAWRTGDTNARLAFWVADAPAHPEKFEAMANAIRDAAAQDIHVYPVASSGIDKATELGMRSAAQLTGGRYLFLTDDSGVGGSHLEPSIPCYFVTRLDDAIVRMVDIELSGKYREPSADEVIRTGGDPQDRACTLESGEEVTAF